MLAAPDSSDHAAATSQNEIDALLAAPDSSDHAGLDNDIMMSQDELDALLANANTDNADLDNDIMMSQDELDTLLSQNEKKFTSKVPVENNVMSDERMNSILNEVKITSAMSSNEAKKDSAQNVKSIINIATPGKPLSQKELDNLFG